MKKQHTQLDIINALMGQIKTNMNDKQIDPKLRLRIRKNNDNLRFILRYFMPYKTEKIRNGNTIFLNRGYKPIGLAYESFNPIIDYEAYENVSFKYRNNDDIYFYKDSNPPWDNKKDLILYMEKIEKYINKSIQLEKEDYPYVDDEYFIKEDDRYITYRTIRDKQPLFAMFAKHDYSVSSLSVELEDDVDAIREVVKSYDELWN